MQRVLAADPRDVPIYTVAEAAHYLRLPRKTLADWIHPDKGIITPEAAAPARLSFSNLVEAFVLAALRRVHEVPLQKIRPTVLYIKHSMKTERPLIQKRFRTDGVRLFVEHAGAVINASSERGQHVVAEVANQLERIEWDEAGVAAQLFPLARSGIAGSPFSIAINPRVGFGRPVIAGTGIRVEIVAARYRAGDSHMVLAKDYNVDLELIEDAIRTEMREAA